MSITFKVGDRVKGISSGQSLRVMKVRGELITCAYMGLKRHKETTLLASELEYVGPSPAGVTRLVSPYQAQLLKRRR